MLGGQVLLLLVGLTGTAPQGQDLGERDTSVTAMSNRGDWAWLEMCPKGFYTSGVSFKVQPLRRCPRLVGGPCSHGNSVPSQVEPPQGVMEDDTALNGIWLHCSRSGDPSGGYTAESQSGSWGHWLEARWCTH